MSKMNFWKKKIKNVSEISKATGIDEEKIKELKEGKREIGGETMEKVLNAINETNKKTTLEKKIEKQELLKWFEKTNIKQLVKDFNYKSQTECANKIGVSKASFNQIANGDYQNYSKVLQKIYDFFNDDFNKKVVRDNKTQKHRHIQKEEKNNINIPVESETSVYDRDNEEKQYNYKESRYHYYKDCSALEEINDLKRKIERYEKIIDKLL